jgi:hypothetical protein
VGAVLLSYTSSMKSLSGMVQRILGVGRVIADTCMVEAVSGAMLVSTVGLAGAMQIFALKMDQRLTAVMASLPCA